MPEPDLLLLAMKMAIGASIVVLTSLIAEKSSPFIAAMVATLPVSAGPILAFLALDHDDAFMAQTVLGSILANLATALFCLVYALLAQYRQLALAWAGAFVVWISIASLFRLFPLNVLGALGVTVIVFPILIAIGNRFVPHRINAAPPRTWYAIPLRAIGVSLLILIVTRVSWSVGPFLSGTLAVFPVVMTSLIVILHPRIGGPSTATMIVNALPGLLGFAFALAAAHLAMVPLGRFWALLLGLALCFVWNGGLVLLKRARAAQA